MTYFILFIWSVDCFQGRACWGDNEHAGETVWIPNNKLISLLPDAARAWSKRIVMSSGYGNFQTGTEQMRSKETSTNCLLAKHRCIGKRGLCALCNRQRESSVIAYTHTHTYTTIISSMSCKEWVLHNGCCASLMYLPFKTMAQGGAAIPGGNIAKFVTEWTRRQEHVWIRPAHCFLAFSCFLSF